MHDIFMSHLFYRLPLGIHQWPVQEFESRHARADLSTSPAVRKENTTAMIDNKQRDNKDRAQKLSGYPLIT